MSAPEPGTPGHRIEVRKLVAGDEGALGRVAPGVFDEDVRPELAKRFLETPNYRIFVALDGDVVVGMVTGFTHFHPDKDIEFFVNELGVDDAYRRQGIAMRLMQAILAEAKAMGCEVAWVGTERDNAPALGVYRKLMSAADEEDSAAIFTYALAER